MQNIVVSAVILFTLGDRTKRPFVLLNDYSASSD